LEKTPFLRVKAGVVSDFVNLAPFAKRRDYRAI
jgi:hypothetical protein